MDRRVRAVSRGLFVSFFCYLTLSSSVSPDVFGQPRVRQSERQAPAGFSQDRTQLVQFESILPHVVFGERDGIRSETEIVVTNPDSRPALLELTFYQPSGEPVHELFQVPAEGQANQSTWAHTQGLCPATLVEVFAGNEHFSKSGKLVTLGSGLTGRTPVFRALADPNLVEVEMGSGCRHFILTVDLTREEIVSSRRGSDYCWF